MLVRVGDAARGSVLAVVGVPLSLVLGQAPWVVFVAVAMGGFSWEPFAVFWASARHTEIPAERLGRVSSVDWMASFGLMPLGLALSGPAVARIGEDALLLVATARAW